VDFNLTLIGQSIAMIVFVWFCMKFVWPPITSAIEQRQTEIADGLAAAEQGKNSLTTAKVEVDKIIAAARDQARGIVDQANNRATSIVEQGEASGPRRASRGPDHASAPASLPGLTPVRAPSPDSCDQLLIVTVYGEQVALVPVFWMILT